MKRKMLKMCFHVGKFFIGIFVFFDSRVYMYFFNKLLNFSGIKLNGKPRFVAKNVKFDDFSLIALGDRVVISSNVIFLTHDYSFTTGLISINEKPNTDIGILGPIEVGNNVFIGMNSILLPGTKIGNNVIIGAGSVVRGTIKDNSVISGNPANIICDIESHIEKLKSRNYNKLIDKK
jgi:acetyltransferase-like isoleucine patch superfamily enzyme